MMSIEKDSLELLCRFAYKANEIGQCGDAGAHEMLKEYIVSPGRRPLLAEDVRKVLSTFPSINTYLQIIASKNNAHRFDYSVAEAYALSNHFLDKATSKYLSELLNSMTLPDTAKEKLLSETPNHLPLNHNFNVLYIDDFLLNGMYNAEREKKLNECIVNAGMIIYPENPDVYIKTQSLKIGPVNHGELSLRDEVVKMPYDEEIFPDGLKGGKYVATHSGSPFAIIELDDLIRMSWFTHHLITAKSHSRKHIHEELNHNHS